MKINRIKIFILKVGLGSERFYSSQCAFPERKSLLVRIDTDQGISGWGEGGQYGPPEPVSECIGSVFANLLIGRDPINKGRIWEELYSFSRDFGQKGPYIEAISAIDIALWDIIGKALNCPISDLLGGRFWESIPAYATGCYYKQEDLVDFNSSLERLTKEAAIYVKAGFKMLKMKIGLLSIEEDIQRIATVRNSIGPDVILLVDCNHSYNSFNAIHIGRMLEKYDVRWMEEPVLPEDKEGYRRIRNTLNIAVAGGECEYTRYGFKDLITTGCVDIAQPDICVCGGISEVVKIQALAQCFGVMLIPHVWGSGIATATALQFISTIPPTPHTAKYIQLQNRPVIEFDRNHNPLREDLLKQKILIENSLIKVPEGPGLGVEINMDILEKYCVYEKEII